MTLREKVKEVEPELVYESEDDTGGVVGCPYDYDYLQTDDLEFTCPIQSCCYDCWNREYKGRKL